jgi:hypothetical protein
MGTQKTKKRLRFFGRPACHQGRVTAPRSALAPGAVFVPVAVACEDGECSFCRTLEQWICHCGAVNEDWRSVCYFCDCRHWLEVA